MMLVCVERRIDGLVKPFSSTVKVTRFTRLSALGVADLAGGTDAEASSDYGIPRRDPLWLARPARVRR